MDTIDASMPQQEFVVVSYINIPEQMHWFGYEAACKCVMPQAKQYVTYVCHENAKPRVMAWLVCWTIAQKMKSSITGLEFNNILLLVYGSWRIEKKCIHVCCSTIGVRIWEQTSTPSFFIWNHTDNFLLTKKPKHQQIGNSIVSHTSGIIWKCIKMYCTLYFVFWRHAVRNGP